MHIMYPEPAVGSEAVTVYSRSLRIHKSMSTLPPTNQRSSSIKTAAVCADTPVPEYTSCENVVHNPLHRPSPTYRHSPEGIFLSNEDKSLRAPYSRMPMPSAVCEDTEQEILLPSSTRTGRQRNQPFPSQDRCLTHLSPLQPRPPILPQPSLPLMHGSTPLSLPSRQTLDPDILPQTRSQLTVSLLRPASGLTYQQTVKSRLSPYFEEYTPIPVTIENANPTLERQKLKALVIASGLGDNDKLRTNVPANNCSPSRAYLEPHWSAPIEVKSSQDEDTKKYVAPIMPQKQFVINRCPSRTSAYLQDESVDSELEDASYYVKETNSLLLPYCHPSKISPVSKWSLSSSVKTDLANKRSSPSKYLKTKAVKFWSFITRFSSNSQSNSSDKHALSSAVDVQEKSIRHQHSHSDLVESISGCSSSSVSLQTPAFTYGLWDDVPTTPITALSMARISSRNYSAATPNNHEVGLYGERHCHLISG